MALYLYHFNVSISISLPNVVLLVECTKKPHKFLAAILKTALKAV